MADKNEDKKVENMVVWGVVALLFISLPFVVDLGIDLGLSSKSESAETSNESQAQGSKNEKAKDSNITVVQEGTGESPTANSFVTLKYSVLDAEGKELYKTKDKGTMRVMKREPKAIQEALMSLKVGGRSQFKLTEDKYKGFKIPGKKIELKGELTFDFELLKVKEMPKPKPREVKQVPPPSDVAAPPADALKTASGLSYKVLKAGEGDESPDKNGAVKVHYTGWQTDGKTFDSSVTRGKPATFGVGQVIKGWTEGLQLMKKGEKTRFWIPENLAYMGKREPKGMLVFDVELLEIIKPPETPSLTAPKKAKKTESGLAYEMISKGPSKVEIKADSMVMAHLSVWDLEGALKQSSKLRGQPQRLMLAQPNLPALLKEAVLLLKEGDSGRFWLPGDEKARGFAKKGLILEIEVTKVMAAPKRPPMRGLGGKGHAGHGHPKINLKKSAGKGTPVPSKATGKSGTPKLKLKKGTKTPAKAK